MLQRDLATSGGSRRRCGRATRPIGQLRERDEVLLVLRRHETGRDLLERPAGEREQAAVDHQRDARRARISRATPREYLCDGPVEEPVERTEEPAERAIHDARDADPSARGDCAAAAAHSAGESVSELNAEMTVEIAIVIANCL